MAQYNGHRNYNHWNVALWLSNDEGLYNLARAALRNRRNRTKDDAARAILEDLNEMGITETPDGAPYSYSAIRAALSGLE